MRAQRLLTDLLKYEWSKAHEPACKLEHAIADKDLLTYLSTLGNVLGANVGIVEKAPFDGPITVKARGGMYAIGRKVASVICVKNGD